MLLLHSSARVVKCTLMVAILFKIQKQDYDTDSSMPR